MESDDMDWEGRPQSARPSFRITGSSMDLSQHSRSSSAPGASPSRVIVVRTAGDIPVGAESSVGSHVEGRGHSPTPEVEYDSDTALQCTSGCVPPIQTLGEGSGGSKAGSPRHGTKRGKRRKRIIGPLKNALREWKGKRGQGTSRLTRHEVSDGGVEMKNPAEGSWTDVPLGPDPFQDGGTATDASGAGAIVPAKTGPPPALAGMSAARSPDLEPNHLDTIYRICSGYEPVFTQGTTQPTLEFQALKEYIKTITEDHLERYYLKVVALQTEAATAEIDIGGEGKSLSKLKRNIVARRIKQRRLGDLPRISVGGYQLTLGRGEEGTGKAKVGVPCKGTINVVNAGKGKCFFSFLATGSMSEYRLTFDPPSITLKRGATGEVEVSLTCLRPGYHLSDVFILEEETGNRILFKLDCDVESTAFGVALEYLEMVQVQGMRVPRILEDFKRYLYNNGALELEGIFRVESNSAEKEAVRDMINRGRLEDCKDVTAIASMLKEWLRYLPGNIFNTLPLDKICDSPTEEECVEMCHTLPQERKDIMRWLLEVMADVCKGEPKNKMNARNLAIVFAPNLMEIPYTPDMLVKSKQVVRFLYMLLAHHLRTYHKIRVPAEP